jgi:protocatechuate 3,4-dioxygenase beta subunit
MNIYRYIITLSLLIGSLLHIAENKYSTGNSCEKLSQSDLGFIKLTDDDEKGEKLTVYGQVIDFKTGQPIKNTSVFLYQADATSKYNSTFFGMPSYARIRGKIQTDVNGCFKFKTIVPGNYPDKKDGKHIHVVANAKDYEEWKFEFLFEGWISEFVRKKIKINNDAIILNLQNKENGQWMVNVNINLHHK